MDHLLALAVLGSALLLAPSAIGSDDKQQVKCGKKFVSFWVIEVPDDVSANARWTTRGNFRITLPKNYIQGARENAIGSGESEAWVGTGELDADATWIRIPTESYDEFVACLDK